MIDQNNLHNFGLTFRKPKPRIITVCDKCFRASCWHGIFMCDDSQNAGTVEKTTAELRKLKAEHPSYYSVEQIRKVTGCEPRYAK